MEEKEIKKFSKDNPCLFRLEKKCIKCGNCHNICSKLVNIGDDCVYCGQCLMNCPMGAIQGHYDYKEVLNYLNDSNYILIASLSPAVRVSLGDEFMMKPGEIVTGKAIKALRELGFDYVFDTSFGADVTTIEETDELLLRINNKDNIPMFSSCCPAWTKYLKLKHPELVKHLSTTKTPIEIQGYAVKNYFAKLKNIPKNNIIHVAIAPCIAKKDEIRFNDNVDYVITTHEMSLMIKECKIDFNSLKDSNFDLLLSESSGTGEMFGCSSGVTNAIINNLTNRDNEINNDINEIDFDKKKIKCLTIYGLNNFENYVDKLDMYDFIEVMSCEEGCVGGGGQPLTPVGSLSEIRKIRKESLISIKKRKKLLITNNDELKYFYELLKTDDVLHNE